MNYYLVGASQLNSSTPAVGHLTTLPEFRRTTEAMRMAYASCQQALAPLNSHFNEELLNRVSLLVGSAYGELEVTKDFLIEFYGSQLARPTLFQNSLHNAILGFLSIQLKIKGPSITLSNGSNTMGDLIEVAKLQLQYPDVDICVVCFVDSYMEKLKSLVNFLDPHPLVKEGAGVLILAKADWCERNSVEPISVPPNHLLGPYLKS